jgi:CRP-like cAMP-binding protein
MDYNQLIGAPLFKGLTEEAVESVLKLTPFRVRNFKNGSLIAQGGETVTALMIIVNGTAKGEMVDESGRVIKIEDVPAPGALAAAFLFGSRNRFPVNVVAISDVEILSFEKPDFLKLLKTNDKILINYLDMISNRSQFLSEKIKFLNFKTIRG